MPGQQEVMGLWGGSAVVREAYGAVQVAAGERAWMRYQWKALCQALSVAVKLTGGRWCRWQRPLGAGRRCTPRPVRTGNHSSPRETGTRKYRLGATRASVGLGARHGGRSGRVWKENGSHTKRVPSRSCA